MVDFLGRSTRLEITLGEEVAGLRGALVGSEREKDTLRALIRSLLAPRRGARVVRNLPTCGDHGFWRRDCEGDDNTDDSDD